MYSQYLESRGKRIAITSNINLVYIVDASAAWTRERNISERERRTRERRRRRLALVSCHEAEGSDEKEVLIHGGYLVLENDSSLLRIPYSILSLCLRCSVASHRICTQVVPNTGSR